MENSNSNQLPDILKTRIIDDPIENVWKVISTSEGIALWFAPNDFRPSVGDTFNVEMGKPQGKTACKVTKIAPPHLLSYELGKDWNWTFELKDLQAQTQLTFIWSGWDENKETDFGMSHKKLHSQLLNGTNVLIKRLSRSIKKYESQNIR